MSGFITTDSRRGLSTPVQGDTVSETSPYQNGEVERWHEEFTKRLGKADRHGMVLMPSVSGEREFRIRVACQHWAPNHSINDCRYGCAKAEREAAEQAQRMSR
jgi:hypothetical protein